MKKPVLTLIFAIILATSFSSAVVINSVFVDQISPGKEGNIEIEVKNVFDEDVEDVTISLNFKDTPFIPIGTSEQTEEEIKDDDKEEYNFRIKASADSAPGDYEIPYTLEYTREKEVKTRTGTIGVKITANPVLSFTGSASGAIVNKQGTISIKAVNKGFSDARFVSIKLIPDGFTLLSDDEIYIGEIESDDFETASFTVLFTDKRASAIAIVEYINFENEQVVQNIQIPLKIYDAEEALKLGLTSKNNTPLIVSVIITIILLWILFRTVRKRQKLKRSMAISDRR
jgi:hypothetical protein